MRSANTVQRDGVSMMMNSVTKNVVMLVTMAVQRDRIFMVIYSAIRVDTNSWDSLPFHGHGRNSH